MSQPHNEADTLPPSLDPRIPDHVVESPKDFTGILRQLGPGLIIAGSIVGSGELIATTKTGAQAGIALLWLILIGCLIKVFVQIELGRYTISHGETTLSALNRVPGPRYRANWIVWFWLFMVFCTVGQLGGIIGGVGQALAITYPIRGDYVQAIQVPSEKKIREYIKWDEAIANNKDSFTKLSNYQQERIRHGQQVFEERLNQRGRKLVAVVRGGGSLDDPWTLDDRIWGAVIAVLTAGLLYWGRYKMIQNVATVLVVSFTFITIGNVVSLQMTEQWRISAAEFKRGLFFGLPEAVGDIDPLVTALATFGIIGVGATELIAYPYWCLEKGYAKFAGPRRDDENWLRRARGWIRVMQWDAFACMLVYTIATLAFFLMGVSVLYNEGRDPEGMRMVSTLASAYVPIFGEYARWLFLGGALAVLYSTFMVANAGNARMFTDGLKVFGLMSPNDPQSHERALATFSVVLPLLCLAIYSTGADPVGLVLLGGMAQAFMLPLLGLGSLYCRYARTDARLQPGRLWDVLLALSCLGLLIAGIWGVYLNGARIVQTLLGGG